MNTIRILAMTQRHIYIWFHSLDQMISTFFWSTLDVLLWGFTAVYLKYMNVDIENVTTVLLGGLILWLIVNRAQYEIGIAIMEEIWNQNLINIFSTPLKLSEWIASTLLIGAIKIFISIGLAAMLAFILYATNIFEFGLYLIPFIVNLILMGWAIGFVNTGLIFRFGASIQAVVWTGIFLLMPFSAVYYPVKMLPALGQKISLFLPTSYVFEGMRQVIFTGIVDTTKLISAFVLNVIYISLAILFLYKMFELSKKKGLARLE